MYFDRLKEEVKGVGFDLLRVDSDDYLEAVVLKDRIERITGILKSFLGMPVWPSNKKLPTHITVIIEEYGGVMANQALYFYREDEGIVFAMLWPWQDGVHTTLKMAQK